MRAGALACVLAVIAPTAAASAGPRVEYSAEQTIAAVSEARARVATGRLADIVRVAAGMVEVTPADTDASEGATSDVALPPGLRSVVARLATALEVARERTVSSIRGDRKEIARAAEQMLGWLGPRRTQHDRAGTAPADSRRWVEQAVDREVLYGAALMLAQEIDVALPILGDAATPRIQPISNAGCDVVDLVPHLCVGGVGDNEYGADVALQIDLGGNDLYRNSAGGADIDGNGLPVSVSIDLSGDDRYATVLPTTGGATVAQGAVALGGIGILVDSGGDDTYSVTTAGQHISAIGQGSAQAGVGILADLGGDDAYVLGEDRAVTAAGTVQGLGVASLGALAAAVDVGEGRDAYLAQARLVLGRDALGTLYPGNAIGYAFGVGSAAATALFADGGGNDTMRMRLATAAVPADHEGYVLSTTAGGSGFGAGVFAASGVALGGSGDTTWSFEAAANAQMVSGLGATGFGYAVDDGVGVLSDAGGNDRYLLDVLSHARSERVIDDRCECSGVESRSSSGGAEGLGLGAALSRAVAVAHDAAGDDVYDWSIRSISEAVATDRRTQLFPRDDQADPIDVRAEADGSRVLLVAQGAALGKGPDLHHNRPYNEGVGLLRDDGGDDRYSAVAEQRAHAIATSQIAPWATNGSSKTTSTDVLAQGAAMLGEAALRDGGGLDDYSTELVSVRTANPETEVSERRSLHGVQGAVVDKGAALLADIDGGLADTFRASPSTQPCVGRRGDAVWRTCAGAGTGLGVNA